MGDLVYFQAPCGEWLIAEDTGKEEERCYAKTGRVEGNKAYFCRRHFFELLGKLKARGNPFIFVGVN